MKPLSEKTLVAGIGVLILLAAGAAHAEVYRCQKDGVTAFSDKPCAKDAEAYRPVNPLQVIPHDTVPDTALKPDDKLERERKARDAEYARSNHEYEASKHEAAQVRAGLAQGRVTVGMTAAQVRDLMGEPLTTRRQKRKGRETEVWTFRQDDGSRLAVSLHAGKVVSLYENHRRSR
ncbi:MAG: DUF4124 domain-containing protein [Stenotrophobium sp.]